MALIRIKNNVPFVEKYLTIKVKTNLIFSNLRQIQETVNPVDLPVTCNIISESNTVGGINCITDKEATPNFIKATFQSVLRLAAPLM